MSSAQMSEIRDNLADFINRSAYSNERTIIERRGKPVAALVSLEDVRLLMELEAKMDLDDAKGALAEAEDEGVADWEELKVELDL